MHKKIFSLAIINHTITKNQMTTFRSSVAKILCLILLLQNHVMVRPENRADDGITISTADTCEGSSNNVGLFVNREQPHDSSSVNVISMVLDTESTDDKKRSYHTTEEKNRRMDTPQEENNKILDIQKLTNIAMKKPRFLCLHGGGSNAAILEEELAVWPKFVTEKMEFVFINGSLPIRNETDVIQRFNWFNINEVNDNFEEGISYIEDRMIELGPFDGVLGLSAGALIAGALPGMQEQGVCLKKVGKIEHVVLISGAKFGGELIELPKLAEGAYSSPINIPSLHIFGENDFARSTAFVLVEAYVDPLVIYHHDGHGVPTLDEEGIEIMFEFLKKINAIP